MINRSINKLQYNLTHGLMVILFVFVINTFTTVVLAEETPPSLIPIITIKQQEIRPSYPFPTFLSTGPYTWYDNVKDKPLKGHTYRVSTFSEDESYQIFIEKVEFGNGGCCLEIVDYRQLIINETFLNQHFKHNTGIHGFKLIRWIKPDEFEFEAFGGKYLIQNIGDDKPTIKELGKE